MQDFPSIDIGTSRERAADGAGLHRPDPDAGLRNRLRDRLTQWTDQWRTRRDLAVGASSHRLDITPDVGAASVLPGVAGRDLPASLPRSTSPAALISVAAGAALLALGGLWGWQEWSNRSDTPVDDLLPYLVSGEPATAVAETRPPTPGAEADGAAGLDGATGSEPAATPGGVVASNESGSAAVPSGAAESPTGAAMIMVHVSGAVREPGVVEIDGTARVYQALERAGGATAKADVDRINLAAAMVDGERIHVPEIDEEIPASLVHRPESTAATTHDAEPAPVDINTAPAEALEELPGIGPSLAQAIVRTRTERGPFLSVDELIDVPGIGESKLAVLAPLVVVS